MAEVDEAKVIAEPDGSNDETDKSDENTNSLQDRLTGVDSPSEPFNRNMDLESPSSELEHLTSSQHESDSGDSMASGKEGMYEVNASDTGQSTSSNKNNNENKENVNDTNEAKGSRGSVEPVEKKLKTDKGLPDGWVKLSDSRPASVASSGGKSSTPGKDKDPAKKEKDRDREERIKQAQLKLAEERQKKIEELREQQRMAQENREKQLEARRNKIEELKRREEDRRKQVEERRKTQEEIDKRRAMEKLNQKWARYAAAKKEAILNKAKERLTRYEQWKAHGRKGYPGDSPPSKQLSMSMSALYGKKSADFSSSGTINKLGTGNLRSGAESLMALNTIPENRLRRSLPASAPPSRHKSAVNVATSGITGVKMRDPSKMSPRKQRPYSVATSMPSFVAMESETPRPSRSKSTDRGIRDISKTRTPGRKEDEKTDGKERKSATLPRPYDRTKIEERRLEAEKKREERKEREKEREKAREKERMERMSKSETTHEKEKLPTSKALSKSFMERMATPKHPSPDKKEHPEKESSPVKVIKRASRADAPSSPEKSSNTKVKAKPQRDTPTRSPSKSNLKDTKSGGDSVKSESPKSVSPVPTKPATPKATPTIQVDEVTDVDKAESPVPTSEPVVKFAVPEAEVTDSPPKPKPEPKQATPEPKAPKAESTTPKTDKEREMEEYKNKLAEKRRLAREKAEREAEIERIRQEELKRQEEEREREEEEQQRRDEEEALRLAEELRKIEEERLAKAIEAEEKRKREEAERLEQERIQKEEADRKAKEEAERLEKERQEKARKEEEEKIERRKRLDDVLKRFKTDSPASTPTSTPEKTTTARTESPTRVATTSSSGRNSLVSSEDEKGDDSEKEEKPVDRIKVADDTPKFKSPLLQKLTEGKGQDSESGTPKFKSPLLQSIMGKTKLGARLSSTKIDEIGKSTEKLSGSTDRLSDDGKDSSDKDEDESVSTSVVNGHSHTETDTSRVTPCDTGDIDIQKDSDRQEVEPAAPTIDMNTVVTDSVPGHNGHSPSEDKLDTVIDPSDTQQVNISEGEEGENGKEAVTDSQLIVGSTADSAVSLSFNGVSSHNGDVHIEPKDVNESKELVDSSISMRTADSFASSQTWSIGESLADSQNLPTSDSSQFEEVIDLNSHFTNKTLKAQQLAENFLINHNLNDNDDITMSDSSESPTHSMRQPIIAFEDNATRRQDVPDLLS